MIHRKKVLGSIIIAFSMFFLSGCNSYPLVVTTQYVDKPVIMGPYWKINGKIDDYVNMKKEKSSRDFETEVERMIAVSSQNNGNTTTTTTQTVSVHSDNISKEILMQNPKDDELILIRECYIGSYLMAAPGGMIQKTFGGVDGKIILKPVKAGK